MKRRAVNMKKKSKVQLEKRHAMRRYAQRFDQELTEQEYNLLIQQIQNQEAKFIEKQSNRVSIFEVNIHNECPIAIYDKLRQTIITFITKDMHQQRM